MLTDLYIAAKVRWQHFWEDEDGVDGLVVAVILILVAIAAAVIFRDRLIGLIKGWFDNISTSDVTDFKDPDNAGDH